MKKLNNEQTNSSIIPIITLSRTSVSVCTHKLQNMDNKVDRGSRPTKGKVKVYHPKMMIAYKK